VSPWKYPENWRAAAAFRRECCVVLVRTIIVDHLQGVPERSGRWGEIFITVVDKDGAHRSPVAR